MVEDIVQELKNQFRREVSSDEIGELVLRRLKDIDKVAYIRFASVYRDFNDIDSFVRIISELNEENRILSVPSLKGGIVFALRKEHTGFQHIANAVVDN